MGSATTNNMKTIPNKNFTTRLLPCLVSLAISACGSYESVSSPGQNQSVPQLKGVEAVSGRPNLHVPARMGIVTSSRFRQASLKPEDVASLQQQGITTVIPVNGYIDQSKCYSMPDLMYQRAQIIKNTKFLNLDLILLCDENSDEDTSNHLPILQPLSLGIINPATKSTQVQVDAALMDARTGYIYGALGGSSKSNTHSLTFIEAEAFADAGKNRASRDAKKQLVQKFPTFWESVKKRHGK